MANFTQFDLPANAYANFDAQSLRDVIIDRINNDSSINFTDQNLEEFVSGSMNALSVSFAGNPINFGEEAVRKVYNNLIMEK